MDQFIHNRISFYENDAEPYFPFNNNHQAMFSQNQDLVKNDSTSPCKKSSRNTKHNKRNATHQKKHTKKKPAFKSPNRQKTPSNKHTDIDNAVTFVELTNHITTLSGEVSKLKKKQNQTDNRVQRSHQNLKKDLKKTTRGVHDLAKQQANVNLNLNQRVVQVENGVAQNAAEINNLKSLWRQCNKKKTQLYELIKENETRMLQLDSKRKMEVKQINGKLSAVINESKKIKDQNKESQEVAHHTYRKLERVKREAQDAMKAALGAAALSSGCDGYYGVQFNTQDRIYSARCRVSSNGNQRKASFYNF